VKRLLTAAAGCAAFAALLVGAPEQAKKAAPPTKPAAKSTKKKTSARRRSVPKPPPVTAQQRADAQQFVEAHAREAMEGGIANPAAMVPFYEQLWQASRAEGMAGTLRILHFGDSHIATDDWPAAARAILQQKFGSGGPGFVHAGKPFPGFRRYDAKTSHSKGWQSSGLLAREGELLNGISGVSLSTERAGEVVTLEGDGEIVELFYLRQPGGGSLVVEDHGVEVGRVETGGEAASVTWRGELAPGLHSLSARTLSDAPVRLFGWVLERRQGVTWETLGINGAQADLLLLWNEPVFLEQVRNRNPALIVLSYGTNEARRSDWTYDSYRAALTQVLGRLRQAAPAASILLVGAPDQAYRYSSRRILPADTVDRILAAQRDAALSTGCAFWNLRAAMGGKGSMRQWVNAGMAQGDFVHLTPAGYRLWGESLSGLLLSQYEVFVSVRRQIIGMESNGSTLKTH
jgi:lysophospholipase L1-like esterase